MLQMGKCGPTVETAFFGSERNEVAGQAPLDGVPPFGLHLLPEASLQTFAASGIFEIADLVLAPHGATSEHDRGEYNDRQAILHVAILQETVEAIRHGPFDVWFRIFLAPDPAAGIVQLPAQT